MKRAVLTIGICLGAMTVGIGTPSCSSQSYAGKFETLTLAAVPTELNELVYVAEDQNIFARNGLQIILKDYDSGAAAAAGMLNGEAELALAAEFPVVRQVFNKRDITNLGTIARYENTFIIWRADSGIKTIRDLRGKRIGVTLQTISEFYLGRTLELHGISLQQVTTVNVKAAEAEKALADREVDAVAIWEPWVNQISQSMGKEVVTQPLQSAQFAYWNLVSTSNWTNSHAETVTRLMKSLSEAEDYSTRHQGAAKAIVRQRMNFDEAYLDTIWPRYQFSLSLDQSLITAMEEEARWVMSNNLTAEKSVPDFLRYTNESALRAITPEAVNIIR